MPEYEKVVQELKKRRNRCATVDELAEKLKLTERQVRGRIDAARYSPDRYNIENVGHGSKTFQLRPGKWRGRGGTGL